MERDRIPVLVDLLVVLLLGASALAQVWASPGTLDGGRGVHTVLVLGFSLPLLVRRPHAVVVLLVVLASAWLQLELGGGLGQPFFAALIALYSVGSHADYPQTLAGPATILLQVVALDIPRLFDGEPVDEVVPVWFVLVGAWFFGRWMRHRRRESELLTERADKAEQQAALQAEQAVAEERARIARELHDLVAHSMGVIVIQSQGAQRSLDTDPDAACTALAAIESTSRDGLAEMRRLLDLLTSTDRAPMTPQPGIGELDELIANVRSTGLRVTLDVVGDSQSLTPGVELAAYRIVQEALTNVLKHADGAAASVVLRYRPDAVEVEVSDDGPGDRVNGSTGHGLVGMRERVSLYGGSVEAGENPGGGYRVAARIPFGAQP